MRYVEAAGVRLSALGLGTRHFGSRKWGGADAFALGTAQAIVRRALELGVNLVDSAEIYGLGDSERVVGRSVAAIRERAFLASKVAGWCPSQRAVVCAGRRSATRLGVERIDLYQLHWPNPLVGVASTMAGMDQLVSEGTIANVGVSQHSLQQWRSAERALGSAVVSNQVHYSLLHREAENDLIPWAAGADRLVIAYSPLEHGLLSGRYDLGRRPGGLRRWSKTFSSSGLGRVEGLLEVMRQVAAKHQAQVAQVALAWVARLGPVVALAGASSVSQLESNVEAMDLDLDPDDDARLDEATRRP